MVLSNLRYCQCGVSYSDFAILQENGNFVNKYDTCCKKYCY